MNHYQTVRKLHKTIEAWKTAASEDGWRRSFSRGMAAGAGFVLVVFALVLLSGSASSAGRPALDPLHTQNTTQVVEANAPTTPEGDGVDTAGAPAVVTSAPTPTPTPAWANLTPEVVLVRADIAVGGAIADCPRLTYSLSYDKGAVYVQGRVVAVGPQGASASALFREYTDWERMPSIEEVRKIVFPLVVSDFGKIQPCSVFLLPPSAGHYMVLDTANVSLFAQKHGTTVYALRQHNERLTQGMVVFVPGFYDADETPHELELAANPVMTAKLVSCPGRYAQEADYAGHHGLVHNPPQWVWVSVARYISGYDFMQHVFKNYYHQGVDIGTPIGSSIFAADNGVVTFAGWYGPYGNTVVVDHLNTYKTLYAHLSDITVTCGQFVHGGDEIGKAGSTGNSTGPHLHFEIIHAITLGGRLVDTRVNPHEVYPNILGAP